MGFEDGVRVVEEWWEKAEGTTEKDEINGKVKIGTGSHVSHYINYAVYSCFGRINTTAVAPASYGSSMSKIWDCSGAFHKISLYFLLQFQAA